MAQTPLRQGSTRDFGLMISPRGSEVDSGGAPAELRAKLGRLALFKELRPQELDALAGELEWQGLPGGWLLFSEGEQDDSLFVVVAGRLGVVTADAEGRETIIGRIAPGETVGEMALLTGSPRSATVVAMRDSELLRLTKHSFEVLAERHPAIIRFITRLLVQRLEHTSHRTAATASCSTIAAC